MTGERSRRESTIGTKDAAIFITEPTLEWPSPAGPADYELEDYERHPAVCCRVWVEKSTMQDILDPLCHQYRVNLVTGRGHNVHNAG